MTPGRHQDDTRITPGRHQDDTRKTPGRHQDDTRKTPGRYQDDTMKTPGRPSHPPTCLSRATGSWARIILSSETSVRKTLSTQHPTVVKLDGVAPVGKCYVLRAKSTPCKIHLFSNPKTLFWFNIALESMIQFKTVLEKGGAFF